MVMMSSSALLRPAAAKPMTKINRIRIAMDGRSGGVVEGHLQLKGQPRLHVS